MNASEAREIVSNFHEFKRCDSACRKEHDTFLFREAQGYLACLEGEEMRKKDAEIAELKALVKEWLCLKCNTVYPGPPQKGFGCVLCPKCGGDCGPKTWVELQAERERAKALVEALEDNIKVFGCQNGSETYEGQWQVCGHCSICDSEKALAAYRQSVLGEVEKNV